MRVEFDSLNQESPRKSQCGFWDCRLPSSFVCSFGWLPLHPLIFQILLCLSLFKLFHPWYSTFFILHIIYYSFFPAVFPSHEKLTPFGSTDFHLCFMWNTENKRFAAGLHMWENIQPLSFRACVTALGITVSGSSHLPVNFVIHFSSQLSNFALCTGTTRCSFICE